MNSLRLTVLAQTDVSDEVRRASTVLPADVMAAMAATTISPAISAYSNTSPPDPSPPNPTKCDA